MREAQKLPDFDRDIYEQVESEIGDGHPDWERDEFSFGLSWAAAAGVIGASQTVLAPLIEAFWGFDGKGLSVLLICLAAFFAARSYAKTKREYVQKRINAEYRMRKRPKTAKPLD